MTQAVIYARYSPRRNEEKCESNDMQIETCQAYCERQGYAVRAVFEDKALSGDIEDRDGLWDAMDALKRGDVLVVWKLDRLAREVYLSCKIERDVAKRGASIISTTGEGTWGDSPADELTRGIVNLFAQFEKRVTAARTKAAMLRHQRKGRRMSHRIPYGWAPDPDDPARMLKDDEEQAVIGRIVELAGRKYNPRHISRVLESEGVMGRSGRVFSHNTIVAVLRRNKVL